MGGSSLLACLMCHAPAHLGPEKVEIVGRSVRPPWLDQGA